MIAGTKHTERAKNKNRISKLTSPKTIKGDKMWNWKGGLPKCLLCDEELTRYDSKTKKCKNCITKFSKIKELKCLDCKKKKNNYRKRCRNCWKLYSKGKNHWNWQGGITEERLHNRFYTRKREMQKISAGGSHIEKEWVDIKMKYGFMCLCCKKVEPEIKLTRDHIIPISAWKTYIQFHPEIKYQCDDIENIQPLCLRCNMIKRTKIINYKNLWQKVI